MERNVFHIERVLRFLIGVLLITWVFLGGSVLGYFGFYFLATSAWAVCPIYSLRKYLKSRNL